MNLKPIMLAGALCLVPLTTTSQAQSPPKAATELQPDRVIDVGVNYGFNMPVKGDSQTASTEAMETGRRMLYALAANECKLLEQTIAKACRLERLNVQTNAQRQMPGQEMMHISGNASYKVTLK